ncbi:MAG: NAD-binding protein [Promethearchaeota archaeon]
MRKKTFKFKILIKQNWIALTIFILWFVIHFLVFLMMSGGNAIDALAYTFYFKEEESGYFHFYPIMSGFLIFGLILTLLTIEISRKYHPVQTCLALARSMKDHTIIIGYSHLGQRIREYLKEKNEDYVIIDDNSDLVREIIEDEEPVIPKKAHDMEVLKDANIQDAKLVLTTKNDLETLVVSTDLIREVNEHCKIVCRCYDDSIAKIIEKNFNCETISTSQYACEFIKNEIKKWEINDIVILGCNNTTRRLLNLFRLQNINYRVVEQDEEKVADIIDEEPITIGDAKDKDILKKVGILKTDLVIIMIDSVEEVLLIADAVRELNQECYLFCRFFHEKVGEMLEKPPFNALVLSISKHTLQKLIEKGVFGRKKETYIL